MNHRLAKIELRDGKFSYTLIFEATQTRGKHTPFSRGQGRSTAHAKKVIPRPATSIA